MPAFIKFNEKSWRYKFLYAVNLFANWAERENEREKERDLREVVAFLSWLKP